MLTDAQLRRGIEFAKEEIVRARRQILVHEFMVYRAFCEIAEYERILEERRG
jgi:hypothetical protein